MSPASGPPMRRPIRQVTNSPRIPTAAPISRRVSNSVNGSTLAASAASEVEAAAVVVEVDPRQRALVAQDPRCRI